MKPVIAFYDVHPLDQDYFRAALSKDYELILVADSLSPGTAGPAANAEIVSVHVTSEVSAQVMQKLPKLRHLACRTTGYDNVDLKQAAASHITVSSVPAYGEATVAEYAFLLLLAVSRRLMLAAHSVHAGVVTPEKLTGHDLNAKTLGVIGTGRIGRHVARIGRGFGMTVVAYDPMPNPAAARDLGFEYLPLGDLLARADVVTLHAPATLQTHHLLGAPEFAQMKPGAFVINTARGDLIDTPALIEALTSKKLAGAGLDVLEGEEYLQFAPELHLLGQKQIGPEARQVLSLDILSRLPNVLITSHNAYNSAEALDRIRATTVANIRAAFTDRPQNLVAAHE